MAQSAKNKAELELLDKQKELLDIEIKAKQSTWHSMSHKITSHIPHIVAVIAILISFNETWASRKERNEERLLKKELAIIHLRLETCSELNAKLLSLASLIKKHVASDAIYLERVDEITGLQNDIEKLFNKISMICNTKVRTLFFEIIHKWRPKINPFKGHGHSGEDFDSFYDLTQELISISTHIATIDNSGLGYINNKLEP